MQLGHQLAKLAGKILKPIRSGKRHLAIAKEPGTQTLQVTTTSFAPDGRIPTQYAGEDGTAPALAWSTPPRGTLEVAVLCEDPDAPFPEPFVHWTVYGMGPATTSLAEGLKRWAHVPEGGTQGMNSTKKVGYTGPKPPPGHGVHRYHFQVFALDTRLKLPEGADRDAIVSAMKSHVLASGEVVGTFETH